MRYFKSKRPRKKVYVVSILILIFFFILDANYFLIDRSFEYLYRKTNIILVPEKYNTSSEELYMYTFDVGQSEAILLLYHNKSILIDSGTTDYAYPLTQTLESLGISRLDYCIFTHPHYDHMGGSSAILRTFNPKKIYLTKYDYSKIKKWWYTVYKKTVLFNHMSPEFLLLGDTITIDDFNLHVISPISKSYENLNDYSLGIKATLGEIDILLLGDSEASAEHDLVNADIDLSSEILKVSHHGSTTSSTMEFLYKAKPDYAIISVGKNNPYSHPKPATLDKLRHINAEIYRTDIDGTILVITDGKNIQIKTNN